jgi:hypothetical protein
MQISTYAYPWELIYVLTGIFVSKEQKTKSESFINTTQTTVTYHALPSSIIKINNIKKRGKREYTVNYIAILK